MDQTGELSQRTEARSVLTRGGGARHHFADENHPALARDATAPANSPQLKSGDGTLL
jgi:hypothetical protein